MTNQAKRPVYKKLAQIICNNLTVGIFMGIMIGLLVAMVLGVMNWPQDEPWPANPAPSWIQNATGWMQASAAIASALIAGLTVIVVALTLRATQQMVRSANETLDATREMAADQKRIGDKQTRPWLLLGKLDFENELRPSRIIATIHNYGTTPAIDVKIEIMSLEVENKWNEAVFGYDQIIKDQDLFGGYGIHNAIAPNRGEETFSEYFGSELPNMHERIFQVKWSYTYQGSTSRLEEREYFSMNYQGEIMKISKIRKPNKLAHHFQ